MALALKQTYKQHQIQVDHLLNHPIDSITIYQLDTNNSSGLFIISSHNCSGVHRFDIPYPHEKHFDLVQWASVYMRMKHMSVGQALQCTSLINESWGSLRARVAEAALSQLADQLTHGSPSIYRADLMLDRTFLIDKSVAYFSC
ncbi:hypothetical protein NV379_16700 [Paenibacillus sp. N1-5-1-14]|uniref:hypothetical protein n=1 Tax=Paenibacillus radicibacter TaxID=2972488 RepID=UPI002158F1CF|nr:hypothetical protein [Paenibacillus radicibacter]MCR8644294.1 hypothetical protein [Paenibacillus radicibacter]